jgi:hypothetical protein
VILKLWRYGEIGAGVGILVMLLGKAYVLWMNRSRPPLEGVNGIPLLLRHLVGVLVLLNINLYLGNNFWMYFVDFIAVSLVSWRAIIEGSSDGCLIRSWRFGKAVVKEARFQVII